MMSPKANKKTNRDDFLEKTKETLAKRVGMRCSNPDCRKLTSGPREDPDKAVNIGVAAHITAAAPGGPRYDSSVSRAIRSSIRNAIWLCQNCAKRADNDEARHTVEVLSQWKKEAEEAARLGIEPGESHRRKSTRKRAQVSHAEDLARSGKLPEAIGEMTEALSLAREEGDEEEEVEILLGLALLSSDRHHQGDRQHYFQEAEKKARQLKAPSAKVIYYRAKAAALTEKRDFAGAEEAYKAGLAICLAESDDEKANLAMQGCIVRSSFVHFLCNQKRYDEARPLLEECEDYARKHPDAAEAELLQAALEAGIHFSVDTNDEDGAISRLAELEAAATTMRLANRIGGSLINVANVASHRHAHQAALCAAETAIRLGHRCDDGNSPGFLVAALYTEAMVVGQAGDRETALRKAEAVLDACAGAEDVGVKCAAEHLIAELRRVLGDSQSAVDHARRAVTSASGGPEEIAFGKSAFARALNDNGETEEALREAKAAWALIERASLPAKAMVDLLAQIANYGSQLGEISDVSDALARIASLPDEDKELEDEKAHAAARAEANARIRERILVIGALPQPEVEAEPRYSSLQEANSTVMRPLAGLWDDAAESPEWVVGAYDFWGRGNFARLLHNTRCFPNSFNVTVEVRSLDDVKRAVRLWGLYADFLLLLWKGRCQNAITMMPFPEDYEEPGGWGYTVCAGDVLRKEGSSRNWYPAMARISAVPEQVAVFLATEARPFVESGRLVVVPAPAVGCVNPGHGPFEQLLAEAANAIPSLRWKGFPGVPIGLVPHSPNAPLRLLAELAENQSDRLRKLRLLLLQRSRQLRPDETTQSEAKMLALEIDDALRDLAGKTDAFARKRGLERANEPLSAATARFKSNGQPLSDQMPDSPFAPLFILQTLGYGWRVDSGAIAKPPERFEPQSDDVIGTWLAPPTRGWTIPTAQISDTDHRQE